MDYSHLRLAIFGNVYQTKKNQYVEAVLRKLLDLGVQVSVEERFAAFLRAHLQLSLSRCHIFRSCSQPETDVAISIGGDGTFLGTAAQVGASGIPILGINTGRLGFLADVSPDAIESSLEAMCRGDYIVEERTALTAEAEGGDTSVAYPFALNEVSVLKHDNSSLIDISIHVGNSYVASFLADGLIVSTPTGSTGYSLSVGGPILMPGSDTLCLSAVAPHSLSVRPVVIRDDAEVTLRIESRSHNFLLSTDGHSQSFPDTTLIRVRRAPFMVRVMKITHQHYFDTLRDKLLWGADQRR